MRASGTAALTARVRVSLTRIMATFPGFTVLPVTSSQTECAHSSGAQQGGSLKIQTLLPTANTFYTLHRLL